MDKQRIISFVNKLFKDVPKRNVVIEQKEELQSHMEERIREYMANGSSFDDAFQRAKDDLGDVDELIREIEKKSGSHKKKKKRKYRPKKSKLHALTAMAPFIYIMLGFLIPGWQIWAFGWIIIPVTPLLIELLANRTAASLVALTPFIYIGLGILIGGWFWAWGWVIIPMAGIICGYSGPKVTIDMDEMEQNIDGSIEEISQNIDASVEEIVYGRKN